MKAIAYRSRRKLRAALFFAAVTAGVFLFGGSALAAADFSGIEYVPVLIESGEADSVLVRWGAFGLQTGYLHYAEAENGSALPAEHAVTAAQPQKTSGMPLYLAEMPVESGRTYLYGISTDADTPPETLYSFTADDGETLSVLFSADTHLCNPSYAETMDVSLRQGLEQTPLDLIFLAGDVMDKPDYAPEQVMPAASTLQSVPIAVIPGNHDSPFVLFRYLPMPNTEKSLQNYYFIKDNVLFIGLNIWGEQWSKCGDYVRECVKDNPDCDWRVVVIHYSTQSNGSHYSDRMVVECRRALQSAFEEADIDLVFSGHDHQYIRTYLVDSDGFEKSADDTLMEKSAGETLYVTLPTSTGTKYYKDRLFTPPEDFIAYFGLRRETGYTLAEFTPDEVTLTTCAAESGEVVDLAVLTRK